MKKYKAPKGKKQTVNEYIENSFKQNAEIIRPALAEYMGTTVPDSDALDIYTATVLDKLENKKLTKKEITTAINKTLNSVAFKGAEKIDIESLKKALKENDMWDHFRNLNRHQKVVDDNFVRVSPQSGEKQRWEYRNSGHAGKKILISLVYYPDGSYGFNMWEEDA